MACQNAFNGFYYTTTLVLLLSGLVWSFTQNNLENLKQLKVIEKSVNASVNPCDNFYGYACGNWAKNFATDNILEIITLLSGRFEAAVEDVIKNKYPVQKHINQHGQNFMDKALTYYYSCANRGTLQLQKYVREIKLDPNLEWPLKRELLAAYNNDTSRSVQAAGQKSLTDLDIFRLLGSLSSYNFNNAMIPLEMKKVNGSLSIELQTPEHENLTVPAVNRILSSLGFPKEAVLRLTKELLQIDNYWQSSYRKYSSYDDEKVTTFGEVKYLYPSLGKFLENVFPFQIQSEQSVVLNSLSYIEFLVGHKWQPYEMAKISNYLLVKFLLYLEENREEKCITWLRRKMPIAVNYVYYGNIYMRESKEFNTNVTTLTRMILKHFLKAVDRNRLHYTAQQSEAIRQKIREMVLNVGNLPENANYHQVDELYKDVPDLEVNNFYSNDLLLLKHRFMASFTCLGHVVCDPNIDSSPLNTVDRNLVIIPLSSLQPPMYHYQLHPLFSVSLLGAIIGHELAHAIHPGTIELDAEQSNPLFANIAKTSPYFNVSLECMKNQYPTDFFDERISDFVGAHVAYQAYDAEFHFQPDFTKIPWHQLFFLNLAQFFCGNTKADIQSHDSDEVRLNQIAMNSEEFSQAFQCPSASKMNPLEKCILY